MDTQNWPREIVRHIGDKAIQTENIGMSQAQVFYIDDMVLKLEPRDRESDNSLAMLRWLDGKLPVPRVLEAVDCGEQRYILMTRLAGEMACSSDSLSDPRKLVQLLAEGLRMLWAVDIEGCPGNQMLDRKLANARYQVENGLYDLSNVEPETFGEGGFASPEKLLCWLEEHRPEEDPVLSHGDYCLPNVFFGDGRVSGFLDLGRCGVADRWQDIALCWRSLRHNFNGSYGYSDPDFDPDILFEELGIRPDWEKIRYYLLMDELF